MSIFQLRPNKDSSLSVMRSWIDDLANSAVDQLAPTNRELTLIYQRSNIAFRASNKRGDAVSTVPMEILDSAGEPLPKKDPLVEGFQRDIRDTIKRSEITLCFFGYNMLIKRRAYNGNLYRLKWVNPTMYVRDIRPDGLKGFRVNARREQIPETYIKKEDAVFQHEFDFNDDFGGVAPARVAINPIEFGLEMGRTQKSFMANGGAPSWVVSADASSPLSAPQVADADALTNLVKRLFQGSGNSGRTLVQRAAWKWTQLTTDWDKIKFSEQYADMYEAVAIAFDMPIELVRSSAATYANGETARLDWGHSWVIRRCEWYAEQYTEQVLQDPLIIRRYGTGLTVRPNFDDVPMLQETDDKKIDKINKQVEAGYRDLFTAATETGVENPPDALKGYYIWQGIPTPISEIGNLWKYKQLIKPSPFNIDIATGQLLPQPVPSTDVIPTDVGNQPLNGAVQPPPMAAAALPPQTGGKSVALMLSMANNPDLIGLQGLTRKYVGDTQVDWNPPDSFHVTLATMPNATDEQIASLQSALDDVDVPEMTFKVGSLGTFDQLESHALHYKLRSNTPLNDFQEQMYGLVDQLGIPTSGYSLPDDWTPHITMGYAKDKVPARAFYSGLKIKPTELHMSVNKAIVVKKPIGEDKKPPEPPPAAKAAFLPDDVFGELKVAARKGAGFVPIRLPLATVTYIKHLKEIGYETDAVLTAAKSFSLSVLAAKSVSSTQRDFEREFDTLMEAARSDETTRRQASSKLRSLISTYVDHAFQDGLIDGGVDELAVTEEDKQALAKVKSDQSAFITSFLDELFKGDGITDNQAVYKATQWWGLSIYPAYLAGLESAAADNMFTWKLGKTEKHCESCLALDGQRHRFSAFKAAGWLPKGRKLICGAGGLCDCDIIPDPGKERGSLDSVPSVSSSRSHPHDHEQEPENVDLVPELAV